MTFPLSGTGVWSAGLRYGDREAAADAAAELETLGYSALWLPDVGGDVFAAVANLLSATSSATVATGILNLWMHDAAETAEQHHALTVEHGRRFLVGIGVSHAPLINMLEADRYRHPLAATRAYLDGIAASATPIREEDMLLAALGPKMLELARTRTGGSHPYLVTPEHTAATRAALGDGPLVAPEQGVVLERDPVRAREIARTHLAGYLSLPNYSNNWKRFGITDDDIADGGTDRLVDRLVVWGDEATIAKRVREHRDAGADHVCVQVLTDDQIGMPLDQWRRLAPSLTA